MNDTPIDQSCCHKEDMGQAPAPLAKPDFVVKVLLSAGGRMNDYFWNGIQLRVGDHCVVEEDGRPEFGVVSLAKRIYLPTCAKKTPTGKVIRKATEQDVELSKRLVQKEKASLVYCKEKALELGLKMSVSSAHYSFDEKRAVFFFTAENRVDFRELVKELNNYTRLKVELRQIGVRDKARILGGCGPCGGELCCSGFLDDFIPVSIRMAKNQFLALSPEKISGVCGRLLCCLSYENEVYVDLQKKSPKMGKMVRTPDGKSGKVCQLNLLTDKISVISEDGVKTEYDINQIGPADGEWTPPKKVETAAALEPMPRGSRGGGFERENRPMAPPRAPRPQRPVVEVKDTAAESYEEEEIDQGSPASSVSRQEDREAPGAEGGGDGQRPDRRRRRRGRRRPGK